MKNKIPTINSSQTATMQIQSIDSIKSKEKIKDVCMFLSSLVFPAVSSMLCLGKCIHSNKAKLNGANSSSS